MSCALFSDTLIESELFGHERGAFTGAVRDRPGRFELAGGGTLFLDDIDDVPLSMQVKLLRVLQNRTIERLGGTRTVPVNVRIIAGTKHELKAMVSAATFREDLYSAAMPELAQPADGLHPAEDFCDAFPRHVTDGVAGMASGPAIEGATRRLQGDMGRASARRTRTEGCAHCTCQGPRVLSQSRC